MVESGVLAEKNREHDAAPSLRESRFTAVPFSGGGQGATVLDLLWDTVRRNSGAIAISDGSVSLTYAELWNFADAFRRRLVANGVKPAELVGIAAGRSAATIATILGTVMTGACYVPVDVEEVPPAFLKRWIEQDHLRHWVADAKARQTVGALWNGCSIVPLEDVFCPNDSTVAEIPAVPIQTESPLYVMFTSGSTGVPKGVVVPHRAVVRLVMGQSFIEFGPQHTFLLHSPLSFDASTLELWGSLLHGSGLVLAPNARLALEDFAHILHEAGVTTLWLTAAIFHLAAEHLPEMFATLRQLVFGGDVVSPQHVQRMRKLYPTLRMVNGYGPTENTTFTCCYVVPEDYRAEETLPIGHPIAQTTANILDARLEPVADGQDGELVTGGAGVALGYLGQPEATAERFVADPFSMQPGARMYRTGDRVRRRQDGAIEFLGRMDRQIKIAGHRVELTAVEGALAGSPLVADVAIAAVARSGVEKQLVACVALRGPLENAETRLRESLSERFDRAAIPQHWLFLDRLPITANGKLDRAALQQICETRFPSCGDEPAPSSPRVASAHGTSPDSSRTLEQIQSLWARLLGRTAIAEDENFFDLGGTSLLLIEMHARLRTQFDAVPSLVEMFAFPTPGALAARLYNGRQRENGPTAAEQRGQRQRAAMLTKRAGQTALGKTGHAGHISANAGKDGAQ